MLPGNCIIQHTTCPCRQEISDIDINLVAATEKNCQVGLWLSQGVRELCTSLPSSTSTSTSPWNANNEVMVTSISYCYYVSNDAMYIKKCQWRQPCQEVAIPTVFCKHWLSKYCYNALPIQLNMANTMQCCWFLHGRESKALRRWLMQWWDGSLIHTLNKQTNQQNKIAPVKKHWHRVFPDLDQNSNLILH